MIEAKIQADNFEGDTVEIIFTNRELDNDNFVDMRIGHEVYTIPVDDLHCSLLPFIKRREDFQKTL